MEDLGNRDRRLYSLPKAVPVRGHEMAATFLYNSGKKTRSVASP